MRFEFKVFSCILKIQTSQKASFYHISLQKLALLSLVKEVTHFPNRKMIKRPTFEVLFSPELVVECWRLTPFPAKMTLASARANLVLLDVLVLESTGLHFSNRSFKCVREEISKWISLLEDGCVIRECFLFETTLSWTPMQKVWWRDIFLFVITVNNKLGYTKGKWNWRVLFPMQYPYPGWCTQVCPK